MRRVKPGSLHSAMPWIRQVGSKGVISKTNTGRAPATTPNASGATSRNCSRIAGDDQRVRPLLHECCEGGIDLRLGTGIEDLQLPPEGARACLDISRLACGSRVARVH